MPGLLGELGFWISLTTIVVGILILVVPRLLNYLVAFYLIIVGILGLLPYIGVVR